MHYMCAQLYFPFFFLFSVLSDARSLLVRLGDPVPAPVHVPVPVLVPVRMAVGLTLVLDLALARALCSDRHNTYTSHVSQLSYFNVALYTLLYILKSTLMLISYLYV